MLEHGGGLRQATQQYNIPLAEWLDLSTGINPVPFTPPEIPLRAWHRLPEENDGLETAAAAYYGTQQILPVAGSQVAIQNLPRVFNAWFGAQDVAVIAPLYNEHPAAWSAVGHRVHAVHTLSEALANTAVRIIVLCNPNNPTGKVHTATELQLAAQQLALRDGWLVVDEAFMDATPAHSLAADAGTLAPNLIILRSLGKFFGLAGARVGFVIAAEKIRHALRENIGPWNVSHPARLVTIAALNDHAWQIATRHFLTTASSRLSQLLAPLGERHGCTLFQYIATPDAAVLHGWLAQRGILIRHFPHLSAVRFGLAASEPEWQRLTAALQAWQVSK